MKKKLSKILREDGVMYFIEQFAGGRWITTGTSSSVKEMLEDNISIWTSRPTAPAIYRITKFVRVPDIDVKLAG